MIGDDQIRSSLKSSFPVSLLGNIMEPVESVKNLGIILDAENSMQRHVAHLCQIHYYHLQELRRVHRYLNHKTAVKVANALVSSCLDYCNPLLYNTKRHILADYRELRMPYVVLCANKINSVMSHPSCTNYWLPSHYHILFKYNLLTYKTIHFSQPLYLSSLIRRSDFTLGNRLINFLI